MLLAEATTIKSPFGQNPTLARPCADLPVTVKRSHGHRLRDTVTEPAHFARRAASSSLVRCHANDAQKDSRATHADVMLSAEGGIATWRRHIDQHDHLAFQSLEVADLGKAW